LVVFTIFFLFWFLKEKKKMKKPDLRSPSMGPILSGEGPEFNLI